MRKRMIIIHINDNCEEDFEVVDNDYFRNCLVEMLNPYDIEITKIEVKDEKDN